MQKDKRKENKKEIKKAGLALLSFFMLAGVVGTAISYGGNSNQMAVDNPLTNNIKENGVKIKLLKEETVGNNFVYTYSFTVNPANATNQNITAVASYVDGTTYDNVVSVQVDNTAKTIALTTSKTAGFEKQIKVTLTSESDPNVTAEMTLDFTKQFVSYKYNETFLLLDSENKPTEFLTEKSTIEYSKYTIDRNYSLSIENISLRGFDDSESILGTYSDDFSGFLSTYVTSVIKENKLVTANDLWNLSDSNEWHSFLKANSGNEDANLSFAVDGIKINVVDDNQNVYFEQDIVQSIPMVFLYFGLDFSSADFNVAVDSIVVENETVVFGK